MDVNTNIARALAKWDTDADTVLQSLVDILLKTHLRAREQCGEDQLTAMGVVMRTLAIEINRRKNFADKFLDSEEISDLNAVTKAANESTRLIHVVDLLCLCMPDEDLQGMLADCDCEGEVIVDSPLAQAA